MLRRPGLEGLFLFDFYGIQGVALLNGVDHVLPGKDASEHGVLPVEPWGFDVRNEELTAIGVRAGVRHRKNTLSVFMRVVFDLVFKTVAGTTAAGACWIAALNHEVGDDTMEVCSIIEAFPRKKHEIVDGLWG